MGALCVDDAAASRLPRGRVAQYASASASPTGVTVPSTRTCLPVSCQYEREGRARPRGELAALAAPAVGEEDESVVVDGPQEDVADRRRAPLVRGRERHGVGERGTRADGRGVPGAELADRIHAHGAHHPE